MTTLATICVTFNYRLLIKIVLKKRKLIACSIYLFDCYLSENASML